jgi:hypothetical protein
VKRVAVVVAVLLVVSLVGVVLARSSRGDTDDSNDPVGDSVSAGVVTAAPSPPMVPAPEVAAAAAVAMTGDVVTAGLISRRELIVSFTTPGFGTELADVTSEQVTDMRLSMAQAGRSATELSVVEFPLRTHTLARDGESATVDVWSVLVIASPDDAVARQTWRTVTVDLVLVDERWLVDGWKSTDGPSPASTPEGAFGSGRDVADRLEWAEVG